METFSADARNQSKHKIRRHLRIRVEQSKSLPENQLAGTLTTARKADGKILQIEVKLRTFLDNK
jgi:hypothetical protein